MRDINKYFDQIKKYFPDVYWQQHGSDESFNGNLKAIGVDPSNPFNL